MHTLLHIGLALTLTPLMTSALGSLNPHLYSYGSATIGTVQQLAGATGTAVFVTLLAAGTAAGARPASLRRSRSPTALRLRSSSAP